MGPKGVSFLAMLGLLGQLYDTNDDSCVSRISRFDVSVNEMGACPEENWICMHVSQCEIAVGNKNNSKVTRCDYPSAARRRHFRAKCEQSTIFYTDFTPVSATKTLGPRIKSKSEVLTRNCFRTLSWEHKRYSCKSKWHL